MNKRNLYYVNRRNTSSGIALAKDKYKSKAFFAERGVPVPETYALIESYQDLLDHDFSVHPKRFVVKPNKGSKGNGIMVVTKVQKQSQPKNFLASGKLRQWWQNMSDRYDRFVYPTLSESDQYFRVGGVIYNELEFKYACARILYGSYSLSKKYDAILVEECLVPGSDYEVFCEWGLADVRVIVFNHVPIAAMVRVPTEASEGKANIAQGGIACGVNIATGKIDRIWIAGQVYQSGYFPEEYSHFDGYRVPFWHEVLYYSSMIQFFSDLGYIGIDRVIGDDGPMLLEVNARPGLEIQNVTGVRLDALLSKVADLQVHTPQKAVEIATSLFSPHEHRATSANKGLALSQSGMVQWVQDGVRQSSDVIITVSVTKKLTYLSPDVAELLIQGISSRLVSQGSVITPLEKYKVDESLGDHQVLLGTNALQGYVIQPVHMMKRSTSFLRLPSALQGDDVVMLELLDEKLHQVAKQISLSKILQPTNYLEEMDAFIEAKGHYNPQFTYAFPTSKKISSRRQALRMIETEYRGKRRFVSPFGQMLYDYMDEIGHKISLIEAYKKQDPDAIRVGNELLYGGFDDERVQEAMDVIQTYVATTAVDDDLLTGQELLSYIRSYLDDRGLWEVRVIIDSTVSARMATRLGNNITLAVSTRVSFGRNEIDAILAHEVGVHVMRYLAGQKSGWYILRKGTAQYVITEEGLALCAAEEIYKSYNTDYINYAIYWKYILTMNADRSFDRMYAFLCAHDYNPRRTIMGAFHLIARQKKGVQDTSDEALQGWLKPKIYLDGYKLIEKISSEEKSKLMCGKIAVKYSDFIA